MTKPGRLSSNAVDANGDRESDIITGPFDRGQSERSCTTLQIRPDQETEAFQAIPYWASVRLQQDADGCESHIERPHTLM